MRFALAVLACALAVANAQYNRFNTNNNFGSANGRYQGQYNQGQYNQGQLNRYQPFNKNNAYQAYKPFASTTPFPRPAPVRATASVSVIPAPVVPVPFVPVVPAPVAPVRVSPVVPPAPIPFAKVASDARSAETVRYDSDINPDGSYNYFFETNNGIAAQAQGTPRNLGGNPPVIPDVVQGSFSWVSPEGKTISVTYVADENGYQPQSDALPTPPALPEQIRRALEYTARIAKN